MTGGQVAAALIFWAAGTAVVYFFWLRDDTQSHAQNLRRLGLWLFVFGAMAGAIIAAVAYATTTGDVPDRYW